MSMDEDNNLVEQTVSSLMPGGEVNLTHNSRHVTLEEAFARYASGTSPDDRGKAETINSLVWTGVPVIKDESSYRAACQLYRSMLHNRHMSYAPGGDDRQDERFAGKPKVWDDFFFAYRWLAEWLSREDLRGGLKVFYTEIAAAYEELDILHDVYSPPGEDERLVNPFDLEKLYHLSSWWSLPGGATPLKRGGEDGERLELDGATTGLCVKSTKRVWSTFPGRDETDFLTDDSLVRQGGGGDDDFAPLGKDEFLQPWQGVMLLANLYITALTERGRPTGDELNPALAAKRRDWLRLHPEQDNLAAADDKRRERLSQANQSFRADRKLKHRLADLRGVSDRQMPVKLLFAVVHAAWDEILPLLTQKDEKSRAKLRGHSRRLEFWRNIAGVDYEKVPAAREDVFRDCLTLIDALAVLAGDMPGETGDERTVAEAARCGETVKKFWEKFSQVAVPAAA